MYAVRLHAFGPADNLRYEEVKDPEPGPGQVRIHVEAAGVHLIDTSIRSGEAGPFPLPELPAILGREVAGVVDALGDGVDPQWLGRRVVAHLGPASGGYAELAIANAAALHALPDDLAFDAAVAMIGTGRTAMGILEVAEVTADDVVLVTAAAGGIGSLLVQAARRIGATVIGAAGGPAKVATVQQLGADIAVDYLQPDWTSTIRSALDGRAVSVIFDGVGGALGRQSLEVIGLGGRLLMYGGSAGDWTSLSTMDLYTYGISAAVPIGPRLLQRPGGLRPLEEKALAAAATRELVPLIGTHFPLREAAAAHKALVSRATTGKVVLIP